MDNVVQVSQDRKTVWVLAADGSTVGRFSKRFGMDVHTTITEQLEGADQCLRCKAGPPTESDWHEFCELMQSQYGIHVGRSVIQF